MLIVIIGYPHFTYNFNFNFLYIFFWELFKFIMDISERHTLIYNDRLLLCYHEGCLGGTRPVDKKWTRLYVQDGGSWLLFNVICKLSLFVGPVCGCVSLQIFLTLVNKKSTQSLDVLFTAVNHIIFNVNINCQLCSITGLRTPQFNSCHQTFGV